MKIVIYFVVIERYRWWKREREEGGENESFFNVYLECFVYFVVYIGIELISFYFVIMDLVGKVVLVMGGFCGIGKVIIEVFLV